MEPHPATSKKLHEKASNEPRIGRTAKVRWLHRCDKVRTMKSWLSELKSDTWAIISALSGWSAVMVTVMLALHTATNARIDAQSTRIDMLQDTMREEHNALRDEHTAMRNEHTLILESLAAVAQRVSYIEGYLDVRRTADSEPAGPP